VEQVNREQHTPLTPAEEDAQGAKLMEIIDKDKDGQVSYEEFERFFLDRAHNKHELEKRLIIHHVENADNIRLNTVPNADNLEKALTEAEKYWKELDEDSSGTLVANELNKLVAFVVGMVAGPHATLDDVAADTAMAKSFAKAEMRFEEFEALLTTLYKRQADFEVMLSETVASSFNEVEAQSLFEKLDADKTGFLEGSELKELSLTVFGEFAPGGIKLTKEQTEVQTKKMLKVIDRDGDAKVSFKEFSDYFAQREAQLNEMRRQQKLAQIVKDEHNDTGDEAMCMTFVLKKFKELDIDNSGALDRNEARVLADWVYTSFRPDGKKLPVGMVDIETDKLLSKLDADHDALIAFEEFEEYFNIKYASAKKYERAMVAGGETHYKNMLDNNDYPVAPVIGRDVSLFILLNHDVR